MSPDVASPVRLAPRDIIASGLCIGCGSCASGGAGTSSPVQMQFDRHGLLRPAGSADWLRERTSTFAAICPFSPAALDEDQLAAGAFTGAPYVDRAVGRFRSAFVGHVDDAREREHSSSGGMVSWVLIELLRSGIVDGVAHVAPADPDSGDGRLFRHRIARTEAEIRGGARSRYYPTHLADVLTEIRNTPGRYAVVGVPCFIKAVQLSRRNEPVLNERIVVTLGLFCGHMKSARFLESLTTQMQAEMNEVAGFDFRRKDPTRPASTYTAEVRLRNGTSRVRDWWNMVDGDWGAGFFQSPACNACDDVVAETADISFGDAWVEPYTSDGRGTNVVVTRSALADEMIRRGIGDGRLRLEEVGAELVEETQAAGFRQRREGLAYRLTWRSVRRQQVVPVKRVPPSNDLPLRRKLIYRSRHAISAGSHRMFWLARRLRRPGVYRTWARVVQHLYQGLTYSRGRFGRAVDRILPRP